MDSNEKKLKSIMSETLKELVLSRLAKIEENQKKHDEKLDMLIETVGDVKVDVTTIQEDMNDMGYTIERIETRLNTVINNQDDISVKTKQLNRRVLKLETKRA